MEDEENPTLHHVIYIQKGKRQSLSLCFSNPFVQTMYIRNNRVGFLLSKRLITYRQDYLTAIRPYLKAFQPHTRPSRKHKFQLVSRIPRDDTRGVQTNYFYFRTVRTWIHLPEEVVNATTVKSFKRLLKMTWVNEK